MKTRQWDRRSFLKSAATAGAGVAFPVIVPSSVFGASPPSTRIHVALIGIGNIMRGHLRGMCGRPDVQVLAVCDCHRDRRMEGKNEVDKAYAQNAPSGTYRGCDAVHEFERIVDRADIDAVIIGTPDQWHAPIACAAIRAGKDVYVEKPMILTQREGRVMSDLARTRGAVVQVGSQQRSNGAFRRACEIVRNGWIGRVHTVYARLGQFPPAEEFPEQLVPDGFDYDRWLGPTPWLPYHEERVRGTYGGGWRRFWEYGSRKNGDWGAHHFDIIQWALGMDDSGPVEFIPKGFEGAEHQTHVYADKTRVLRDHPTRNGQMIQFIGDKGEVCVSRGDKLETVPETLKDRPLMPGDTRLYESSNHHEDWLACIRSRRNPICHAEIGHRTGTICCLSGIAERLGRPIRWDPAKEEIIGDPAASRWLDRPRRAPYVLL